MVLLDQVEVQDSGAEGNNAGTRYNFSNSTVDADPGTGILDSIAHQLQQQQ
jgi:hypothetical protein